MPAWLNPKSSFKSNFRSARNISGKFDILVAKIIDCWLKDAFIICSYSGYRI